MARKAGISKRLLLTRLQDRFRSLVLDYLDRNQMNQKELSELLKLHRPHVCSLLSETAARPLSAYYLFKFIKEGIFKVADIYDGQATDPAEVDFWATASEAENYQWLNRFAGIRKTMNVEAIFDLIKKLDAQGLDVEAILRSMEKK